jgi:hypothetical protein
LKVLLRSRYLNHLLRHHYDKFQKHLELLLHHLHHQYLLFLLFLLHRNLVHQLHHHQLHLEKIHHYKQFLHLHHQRM